MQDQSGYTISCLQKWNETKTGHRSTVEQWDSAQSLGGLSSIIQANQFHLQYHQELYHLGSCLGLICYFWVGKGSCYVAQARFKLVFCSCLLSKDYRCLLLCSTLAIILTITKYRPIQWKIQKLLKEIRGVNIQRDNMLINQSMSH